MMRPQSVDVVQIGPNGSVSNYWHDLWRYRELFLVLAGETWPFVTSRLCSGLHGP